MSTHLVWKFKKDLLMSFVLVLNLIKNYVIPQSYEH